MRKLGSFVIGAIVGVGFMASGVGRVINDKTKQQKNQIIDKYEISVKEMNKIERDIARKGPMDAAKNWQRVLDSLETKAAVEKAYHEGAQMVRDSLKNANLKNASKLIK